MGYDLFHREPGQSISDFFLAAWESIDVKMQILDQEVIETGDEEVPWVICTIERHSDMSVEGRVYLIRQEFRFESNGMLGIKEMSETAIPVFTGYPPRLLLQLPDTNDVLVLQWRERCWRTWYQQQKMGQ